MLKGIANYARHLGATAKFNLTLSQAILCILADRMTKRAVKNLDEFLLVNDDLFGKMIDIVRQYYSDQVLFSNEAKATFIQPDLMPLPKKAEGR